MSGPRSVAGLGRPAGEEPGANQEDHRERLRLRCRDDRHALPGVPDERRGLPGPDQQEVQHQVQDSGVVLLPAHGRGLRCQRQG